MTTAESTIETLKVLSPDSQDLVAGLVRSLAEREGIDVGDAVSCNLASPAEGVSLWVAKLKQEGYSKRTIDVYMVTVRNYLKRDPKPTKLSIQYWLAERTDTVSPSRVAGDRKALRSLFSFLHSERLWPTDPTASLKSIKISYKARDLPEAEDVAKIMAYQSRRPNDIPKFQLMTLILVTTGLRVSEAAGIEKKKIDFRHHELAVLGKGNKEGTVPLLPITEAGLKGYLELAPNDSRYLFPGNTDEGYWSVSSYQKALKLACRHLGLPKTTPHQFRHFFATFSLRNGAKLEVISKILRHASVSTTANIYRHIGSDEIHETARLFAPLSNAPLALPETIDIIDGEAKEIPDKYDHHGNRI